MHIPQERRLLDDEIEMQEQVVIISKKGVQVKMKIVVRQGMT